MRGLTGDGDRIRLADKKKGTKDNKETVPYLKVEMENPIISSYKKAPARTGNKAPKATIGETPVVKQMDKSSPLLMMRSPAGSGGAGVIPPGMRR